MLFALNIMLMVTQVIFFIYLFTSFTAVDKNTDIPEVSYEIPNELPKNLEAIVIEQ